ncbi:MAG: TldD/PmbA family protein [Nitrospinae bacterium]|nr:TldD/PmbA family protein [Nitrospinota bacterium]
MLDKGLVRDVLDQALSKGGDFAEVFAEETARTMIQYSSNEVEKALSGREYGVGIRILFGRQSAYAYTNDLSREGLIRGAAVVAAAAPGPPAKAALSMGGDFDRSSPHGMVLSRPELRGLKVQGVALQEKLALIEIANREARAHHTLISQVQVSYLDEIQHVLIANSDGLWVEDDRVRTRLHMAAVASKGAEKQVGSAGPGACQGFELYSGLDIPGIAREAAETAVVMVQADYAPGGKMAVIIDKGFGGVIFHEACGHSLEGYAVSRKASVFAEKLGQEVASPLVNVVDDGTLENTWGSTRVDDEGVPTERTLLIERGILRSFMLDRLSGRILGLRSTGNGRRQSYRFAPVSRMRNTFILPGTSRLQEMIEATPAGLYAKKMGGGSVNPATGEFNFAVMEGYLIHEGKIEKPVRGATLIGNGKEILHNIDMVGDELQLEPGMCGAASGSVPTTVGQPVIRVQGLVVGGRGRN